MEAKVTRELRGGLPTAPSTQGPAGLSGSLLSAHLNVTLLAAEVGVTGAAWAVWPLCAPVCSTLIKRFSSSSRSARNEHEEGGDWTRVAQAFPLLLDGVTVGVDLEAVDSTLASLLAIASIFLCFWDSLAGTGECLMLALTLPGLLGVALGVCTELASMSMMVLRSRTGGGRAGQGRAFGMVCGAEFGGVGMQSFREVGVLGGVFSL